MPRDLQIVTHARTHVICRLAPFPHSPADREDERFPRDLPTSHI
jgi:hypothetical protein